MKFKDFKLKFYSRFTDLSVFDCQDFNLLKVVLDGLLVNYTQKGKIRNRFLLFNLQHYLLGKRSRRNKKISNSILSKEVLLLDSGRIDFDEDNQIVSSYFQNILNDIRITSFAYATEKVISEKINYDFNFFKCRYSYQYLLLTEEDKELINALKDKIKSLRSLNFFEDNEIKNIKISFQLFFYEFKAWNEIFKRSKFKKVYFLCHYHKEGFILAAKRNKIETIEIQHGIISLSDVFYNFPPSIINKRSKLLFADKIKVYGKYWENKLIKGNCYTKDQINIIGFNIYERREPNLVEKKELNTIIKGKKVILITTQTSISKYFIEYAKFLSSEISFQNKSIVIVMKLHPNEDVNPYNVLKDDSNIFITNITLGVLLNISSFHISIYSTTLFDALRYDNVINLSLFINDYSDYIFNIIESRVAYGININQTPWELNIPLTEKLNPDNFYHSFKPFL
tara:strand:+ start:340 stop:1698 length:1359 start_codon:yes stop_codon:yes gene_type:complete